MNVPTASRKRRMVEQLGPADRENLEAIYLATLSAKRQAEKFADEFVSI